MDQRIEEIPPFDETIRLFLSRASSSSPTPGGGSVAALVAALGASMTSMVANISKGPKVSEVVILAMQDVVEEMRAFIIEFEHLLSQDIKSFQTFLEAMQLSKVTEQEKEVRSKALFQAAVQSTEVPFALAQKCINALTVTESIARQANVRILSDLGVAAILIESAGQSALLIGSSNVPSIQDVVIRQRFQLEKEKFCDEIGRLKSDTLRIVANRLNIEGNGY